MKWLPSLGQVPFVILSWYLSMHFCFHFFLAFVIIFWDPLFHSILADSGRLFQCSPHYPSLTFYFRKLLCFLSWYYTCRVRQKDWELIFSIARAPSTWCLEKEFEMDYVVDSGRGRGDFVYMVFKVLPKGK